MRLPFAAAASLLALAANAHADWRYPSAEAIRLARDTITIDGHVDIPYRLYGEWDDISRATGSGDFDYPRAVAGGLNVPFMSIYVSATFQETGGAKEHADGLIDLVEGIAQTHPDKFEMAYSVADVRRITREERIALPMGMENGAPIGEDLSLLDHFYERGIRYITLTHSRANAICDSSYDINRPHQGLSAFGEQVVRRMNELGIMVDISHVSDDVFWDVMALTDVPVIASHSSARHFTPGFERNMDDEMIAAVGENGGVIMINFGSSFLANDWQEWRDAGRVQYEAYLQENEIEPTPEIQAEFQAQYQADNPPPFADLDDVLDHFDHVVGIAGINHVGIGSDYDGVGDSLPIGLKDAASIPHLVQGLMDRGYSRRQIRKILSGNALRVWQAVERAAD